MPDPKLLIGDHAIDLPEEDRLERSGFVDVLTRTVERAPTRGFVVGLASAWGEGKTSVLNLLAYRLEQRATAQVVRFNPWLFSKADELVERFFSEFSAQVKLGGGRSTQRLAKALERYGRAAAPLRSIPKLGIVVGGTATAAQGGAALMRAGMTLDQRRRDLEHELRKANRPIVVIVDDLDRLQSDQEIAEMVRLIRLVGELPRVAYVVAYDRPVIAVALGAGDEERGQIYLEKVIQAPFDLPPVRSDLLEDLLSATISEAVGDLSGRRFNRERFTSLQVAGLYMLFANMRDVRRYASALPAIIGVLTDEVELSDVLALEALRLREPASFELIADSADVLTGSRDLLQAVRRRDDADAVRMQDIVARARRPEVVRDLVRELFPAGGRHLGGSTYSESFQSVWRRECRVAHPDVFLTYLQRGLPSGRVPARTVEEARTLLNDREALDTFLSKTPEGELRQILGRLEDYEGQFDLDHPEMTIEVLTTAARRLRPSPTQAFAFGADISVSRFGLRILRGRDQAEVAEILDRTMLPDLSTRAELVRFVGYDPSVGSRLVSEDKAETLKRDLSQRILTADAAALRDERDLASLIWQAQQLEPTRTGEQVESLITDPGFLVRWLAKSTLEKRSSQGASTVLPWASMTAHIDPQRLDEALRAISDEWLTERATSEERYAVATARRYVNEPEQAARDLARFQGFDS